MSGILHALLTCQIIPIARTYILKGHYININEKLHIQLLKFQLLSYFHIHIVLGLKGYYNYFDMLSNT
jgi:hypothetical protein